MTLSHKGICVVVIVLALNRVVASEAEVRTVANGTLGKRDGHGSKPTRLVEELSIGDPDGDDSYLIGKPTDIAIDSQQSIFVVDRGYCHVQVYDRTGRFLRSIGRKGEGPGEFYEPTAATIDDFDNLFVAADGRVSQFDKTGKFVGVFKIEPPGGYVRSIRLDTHSNVFVSCLDVLEQKVIQKYNDQHALVKSFCNSYGVGQDIDTRVEAMYGGGAIDLDGYGKVYYTQMTPYEIRCFSAEGEQLLRVTRENDFVAPPKVIDNNGDISFMGGFSGSSAIIVFRDGRFLNVVRVFDPSPKQPKTVIDLFDPDGNLLASIKEARDIDLRRADDLGFLYGFDKSDFPRVVRYRLREN